MTPKKFSSRYILDSNVLLHDPDSLFAYPNALVILPISVIEEIDRFKKDISQNGRNARIVSQQIDQLRHGGSLTEGVALPNGGMLQILIIGRDEARIPSFLNAEMSSNKLLALTLSFQKKHPVGTYLVSNNTNLRIRGATLGLNTISYEEEVYNFSQLYQPMQSLVLKDNEFDQFLDKGLQANKTGAEYYANQPMLLCDEKSGEEVLCRYHSDHDEFRPIRYFKSGIWGIRPKNREQEFALELLMDPDIHVVVLAGKAGTGKTLLALAVALEQMLSAGLYKKILVSRPIFPMGRDMGYLPGDVDEKMAPWMQPIFDNLEFLMNHNRSDNKPGSYNRLLDKGLVDLEPLTYIRGRSIPNRYMIVDEAQNLTPHELKTIVTRVGEGTKLVLTGDPFQIDNPYVDPSSNGISYLIERFRKHMIAGHVNLVQGVRSPLAELAANVL